MTDGEFVGRVSFQDNLIVDSAKNLETLESKISRLLQKFHGIEPSNIKYKHKYDLSALFDVFSFLKISNVAEIAGINASLLRQYVTGNKQASAAQAKKVEGAIQKLGKALIEAEVYGGN